MRDIPQSIVCRFGLAFAPPTKAGQVKVMGDVGNHLDNMESNFTFADPARWKFVSADGQDLVLGAMQRVSNAIHTGYRNHLPGFVTSTHATYREGHKN
jgi:hypothetical protein